MLFIYLDESGNYTFSQKGSEYLIYTSLTTTNPYMLHYDLCELEKELKNQNISLGQNGYFHATEDKQVIRNKVYEILRKRDLYEVDSVIVEKCKMNPSVRGETKLYKKIYEILLRYVLTRHSNISKVVIFVHTVPVKKKKEAMEKGIKETVSSVLREKAMGKIEYHLQHLPSALSYGLQAVDYCCWAFKKKWGDWGEKIDLRPYSEIRAKVKSEFDLCAAGDDVKYYEI